MLLPDDFKISNKGQIGKVDFIWLTCGEAKCNVMSDQLQFETLAITSTLFKDRQTGSVSPPIYLSTTFDRETDGSYRSGFVYSRNDNPNRQMLENSIALLENGKMGFAFSSGMAAIAAIFQTLQTGDHVILPDDAYYSVVLLARDILGNWGLDYSLADMSDPAAVQAQIRPNTTLIWLETPSNPQLKITDLRAVADLARQAGILTAVDNTWPTPVLQRPLDLGVDIVMHSTTKYFGGHSDVLGGCVIIGENEALGEKLKAIQTLSGGVPSPFECWLVLRGIKTLYLRVKQQSQSALELAQYLQQHPAVEKVHYPGLPSHTGHPIAKAQMPGGYGGMLSVQVGNNAREAMELTGRLRLFTTATSLGGVESLVEHRKSIEGDVSTTPENLLRVSVGLENVGDLINDWKRALR